MSTEAAKRSTTGALTMKQRRTDELKPSPALTAEPKKVIIKSTDMKDVMRKEAVNIAISVIMFEEHCNIENLGRVNKVKVKKRITVESLQLEPLCNQKFFKFSIMQLDRNMNHIMITSAYRFCSYRGHKSSQSACMSIYFIFFSFLLICCFVFVSDLVFDGMAEHTYPGWEVDSISSLYLSQLCQSTSSGILALVDFNLYIFLRKTMGYVGIRSSGFRDFLPKPELLRSIVDSGFEHPSEGKVLNSCLMLTFVNSMN
ncbi:hypothetical protein PVK06_004394 [Gossypium arboreum]|uniref:Uncharacterized protein n=1 Tax=Gossypium arboreum TaxID=29729 RepID=A0ABR0QRV6_GOSAR|nr:hypothetical protein PVK06_004394 [Gossypium arboreum]